MFIKYWYNETDRRINPSCDSNNFFNIYNLQELSFSYFISNLINYVVDKNMDERMWFMFPIRSSNGKEDSRITQCCLN